MAIDRETQVLTAAYAGGIRSPRELANFMAQVTHESNGLNRLEESFRYMRGTAQIPVQAAWREGPQVLDAARKDALLGKPQRLAELMYGDRNGNDQPGDGFRYHGRGYLPVPGKDHYRAAGTALGIDLVGKPELAGEPEHAAKIAVWYWRNRVPQDAREDVRAATQALNGRLYGLDDRKTRFDAWERRLTTSLMERLADGEIGKAAPSVTEEASPAVAAAIVEARAKEHAWKRAKDDLIRKPATETETTTEMIDPLLMYEQQRDVMEVTTDMFIPPPPPPPHRHHHHHPHPAQNAHAHTVPLQHESHPQNALFKQAQDAVHKLDQDHQRKPDERSDNLAAALAVEAHKKGMTRIDHVTLSEDAKRSYAVQGELHSPHKQVADVSTDKAVKTTMEQSTEALAQHVAKATPDLTHVQPAIKPPHGH
ncbi:hypothetical protein KCV01_g1482, partial [Aureobasidium melanogenum]